MSKNIANIKNYYTRLLMAGVFSYLSLKDTVKYKINSARYNQRFGRFIYI